MLTLIVMPAVYTYFDDLGARVVGWLTAGKRARVKAEAEVPAVPEPEGVPADWL